MEEAQEVPSQLRGGGRAVPRDLAAEDVAAINEALDGLELEGDQRKTGWLLFVMLHTGATNPDKVWKVAGLDREFVRLRCKRLRDNGVIVKPRLLRVEWFDEDCRLASIGFVLDVLVAEGLATRDGGTDNNGRPTYITTKSLDDGSR